MILIRADANEHIGAGHIMRCLSIASSLRAMGETVKFVTADHKADRLLDGFSTYCLESEWANMESELPALCDMVKKEKPSLLLIDSYYVTESYFQRLHGLVRVAYLDDLNQSCWDVDYLINYNIFANLYDYSTYEEKRTQLLLGTRYVPLRDEFKNCPKHKIDKVLDVLVSAGGADPECITEKIISGICYGMKEVRFHFVIGALNPRLDKINALAAGKDNIVLHINEKRMSELMKNCDLAISAAGTTLYELCATGIPTIAYSIADNQLFAMEQFDKQGIMLSAGDCRGVVGFADRVKTIIEKIVDDRALREELSEKMHNLVDGNGATRIVASLLG